MSETASGARSRPFCHRAAAWPCPRLVNDDALRKGKEMPTLIQFLLVRLSTGFLLGAALAGALVAINGPALGNPDSALEVGLLMYAFGSSFAIGYLASAMVIEFK